MEIDDQLCYACRSGDMVGIENAIAAGATEFEDGLQHASEAGQLEAVKKMIAMGVTKFDTCLCIGCFDDNILMIHTIVKMGIKFKSENNYKYIEWIVCNIKKSIIISEYIGPKLLNDILTFLSLPSLPITKRKQKNKN